MEDDEEPYARQASLEEYQSKVEPLEERALTLSSVPVNKLLHILHRDLIKERNKPLEPPKKQKRAPFFLPTSYESTKDGVQAVLKPLDDAEKEDSEAAGTGLAAGLSRVLSKGRKEMAGGIDFASPLQRLLRAPAGNEKQKEKTHEKILALLRNEEAGGVHMALNELGPLAGGTNEELVAMLEFFERHVKDAHHADLVQTYLTLFLQFHGDILVSDPDLRKRCNQLSDLQEQRWETLDSELRRISCFLKTLTQTQSQW